MQIPIRMIGIVTTFFWIFLVAFFVFAAYSVKDLHFNFGEPQININAENKIVFSVPIAIINKGFYSLRNFNLTTQILHEKFILAHGTSFVPVIRKDGVTNVTHKVMIDFNELLQRNENFLFNDTQLEIYEMVDMQIAEILPIQASTNYSMPWGAPLYNFVLGKTQYLPVNSTHVQVNLPISFENHAFFDVTGNIKVKMYNNASFLLGEGQVSVDVPQQSPYNGFVKFYALRSEITNNGFFSVSIFTPLFNYENWVVSYGR